MDNEIFNRYLNNLSPFNGITLYPQKNSISLTQLVQSIKCIDDFCNDKKKILYKVADWFDHDGFLTVKQNIPNGYLKKFAKDEETLYLNRHGDWKVYWGFYDNSLTWYFRIYIYEKEDREVESNDGTFDITILNTSSNLKLILEKEVGIKIQESPGIEYFNLRRV